MHIFVTGGAGFIGSNFVRYWLNHHPDDKITVFDKLTYAGNLSSLAEVRYRITFIEGDITDAEQVKSALSGMDCVVHFAAESHVDRSIHNPYIFTQTNVLGTHVLLECARELHIPRFHHISTDEVFGEIPLDATWKFNEQSGYHPNSPYAASKAASDHLVRAYFQTYDLPVTISNCSNNFGPYHYPEKFIPRSIIRLLNGENIRLYSPGNQVRDWLYVEDHCRAIDLILHQGKIGETYCVGGLQNGISNIEVAKTLLRIMDLPESRMEMVTDRPGHDQKYDIDWSKLHRELGWSPTEDFSGLLAKTVDWFKANQAWWQPLATESEAFYQTKGEQLINTDV